MNQVKTERRKLRCDLTAQEIHDFSLKLAQENKNYTAIEDELKSVKSQYKAKLDESDAQINKLSGLVTDGFEMREVECEVHYHKPTQGKKTIIRMDQNKTTAVESMQDYEWDLFNQPEDEATSELLEAEREKLRGNGKKK
jgi:hypothetical protein